MIKGTQNNPYCGYASLQSVEIHEAKTALQGAVDESVVLEASAPLCR